MNWHATEAIEKSVKRTRELLIPPDIGLWIKLSIITLFTGTGIHQVLTQIPFTTHAHTYTQLIKTLTSSEPLFFLIASTLIITSLVFYFIQNTMEFVFFQTIKNEEASLIKFFRQNMSRGLRYMAYRLLYVALLVLMSAIMVLSLYINLPLGIVVFLILAPLILVLFVLDVAVRDFVVPQMLRKDENFLEASKKVYNVLKKESRQFGAYIFVRTAVFLAVAVAVSVVAVFTTTLFIVPIVLLAVLVGITPLFLLPLMMVSFLLVLVLIVVAMPFKTFIYSYRLSNYELFAQSDE